jgi:DNA-binding transcriptional regulator YhcF (GntR family)
VGINLEIGMTHTVYVFINETTNPKQYSLTARKKTGAHLNKVIKQMAELGFTDYEIVNGIDKQVANNIKAGLESMFESLGSQIVRRKEL